MSGPGHGRIQLAVVDQSTNYLNKMDEYIIAGMETCLDIAQDLMANNTATNKQMEDLKGIMKDYCKMDRDLKQFLTAIQEVKAEAVNMDAEQCSQLTDMLDERIQNQPNDDAQLQQHVKYVDLLGKLTKETSEAEADTLVPTNTEVGENTELAVTQQEINTKCPFTGVEMQHPVRNKHCSHNYDRDGIKQFIKSRGTRAKCPVSGCINPNPLIMADLEENKELMRHIEKKKRATGKRGHKKK